MGAKEDDRRNAQGTQDEPQGTSGTHNRDDQARQPEGTTGQEDVGDDPDYQDQLRRRNARVAELEGQAAATAESTAAG